jgi:surface antigen
LGAALTAILIAATAGGCSLGGNGGAFAQLEDSDITGSIAAVAHGGPTETDLAFARTAASDVLTKGAKDASQPWENPSTGARGSVTPLAQAYTSDDGRTCRSFLASYVNGKSESWLEGAACRSGRGHWEVQSLKPWRRG